MLETTEDTPMDAGTPATDDLTTSAAPMDAGDATSPADVGDPSTPTAESGQPRERDGRFASKTADLTGNAPSAAPALDAAPTVTDAPVSTYAPPPDAQPLRFKVSGQSHDIPGSYTLPNGDAVIPASHVSKALHLMGQGRHHETTWHVEREKWRAESARWQQQAQAASTAKEVVFEAKLAALDSVLNDPGMLEQAAANPAALKQYLDQQAKMAELQYKVEQAERATQPDPNVEKAALVQAYHATLDDTLAEAEAHPEYGPILRGPYREQILAQINANPYAYLGQHNGQPALDTDKLVAQLVAWKPAHDHAIAVRAQEAKAQKAQSFNAAAAAKAPVVTARPVTPAKPQAPAAPKKQSWADMKRQLLAD